MKLSMSKFASVADFEAAKAAEELEKKIEAKLVETEEGCHRCGSFNMDSEESILTGICVDCWVSEDNFEGEIL